MQSNDYNLKEGVIFDSRHDILMIIFLKDNAMFNIDRPALIFLSLLKEFIRETEHSLAYFFALLVFVFTFLLALFGREALYTGLIGVLCLLLIKLRDIIEGFGSFPRTSGRIIPEKQLFKELQIFYTVFNDAALMLAAKENSDSSPETNPTAEKRNLLTCLQNCRKTIETVCLLMPDQPLTPELKRALEKMMATAQKYLLHNLQKRYALTPQQTDQIKKSLTEETTDDFLFQTQLEFSGIDEAVAQKIVKIGAVFRKIRFYINFFDETETKQPSAMTESSL